MASKLKETGGAAPQHDERITEVIAELRKLNAASKGNALGEKEATGRAVGEEKRAKAKDKKDEKGGWLGSRVGMKEQFTRRFVAARAVNLSLPGNRTNLENQLKLLEFAKNQFDFNDFLEQMKMLSDEEVNFILRKVKEYIESLKTSTRAEEEKEKAESLLNEAKKLKVAKFRIYAWGSRVYPSAEPLVDLYLLDLLDTHLTTYRILVSPRSVSQMRFKVL